MKARACNSVLAICMFACLLSGCAKEVPSTNTQELYIDCVVGLLSDGNTGSKLVAYETDSWVPTVLLELPEVTPDNYAAISSDGKYIAVTTWDDGYVRRYLRVYSTDTWETTDFYRDIPIKNEIIGISWMPDNKTLLFILNDAANFYEEIRMLDVEEKSESTLVKGEHWVVKQLEITQETAEDFYLHGAERYLSVQYQETAGEENEWWNYYLTQEDIDQIFRAYGGVGCFNIDDIVSHFYVELTRPRVSADGNTILYSATLIRTAAIGSQIPLWMCSAIWEYSIPERTAKIIYAPTDGSAIGRVDWINEDQAVFVAYYDFQGSRDSINQFDLQEQTCTVLFPYTDEYYNNVTLLPVGDERFTFTSSAKDEPYEDSATMEYDLSTGTYQPIDIQMDGSTVLLEKFSYTRLSDHITK